MISVFALFPLLCLANALSVPLDTRADVAKEDYRLPQIYNLNNYELSLNVPEDAFTDASDGYTGTVKILFSFTDQADTLKLHAHSDFIRNVSINLNGTTFDEEDYSIDSVTNILSVNISSLTVTVDATYLLTINFTSRLSTEDMYGFYKSYYVDSDNATKYLATTQFEPTHARKAFPCFDEPGLKATFDVSITYPSNLTVLFNTKQKSNTSDAGYTTAVFDQTPKLSTYLIAFIISEFTCTPGEPVDGVTFQVCSRDQVADTRQLAVEIGSKVIDRLNIYTDYNYNKSLNKMDQVAIPDFSAGAMENWGLVTYREAALLWDENESSNRYQQRVTTVIAHEFTHQWFGDLVTCNWWSEIFLNEGFATYFEYHITKEILPDWELEKQFLIEEVHTALVADSVESAQALQEDAYTPSEISARFGTISYNKGGSILRMVAHILGADNFKSGIQQYLLANEYDSAVPEDLWSSLDDIANITEPANLTVLMENWIKKSGFPLVTVKFTENGTVTVSQEKFLFSGKDENNTKWYVPISYTTSADSNKFESTSPQLWLTPTTDETDLPLPENQNISWVILNNQQTGYYRVNYDENLWSTIRSALESENFSGIGDLNRAQIVDDLFNLGRANKANYELVLNTIDFLVNDTSYYPWYAAFTGYDFLLRRVGQNKLGEAISSSILDRMENLYNSVPFSNVNGSDQIYTHKQVLALTWACRLGNEDCLQKVSTLFANYKETGVRPDRNLRTVVYCNALRTSSDSSDWEYLWDAYLNATDLSTEQVTILTALGCTKDATLLNEYLTKTITDGSGIRSQDALSAYSSVYTGNPEGISVAYEFLVENYEKISEKYQSMNALGSLIKGIAERFTTQDEINKLKELAAKEGLPEDFKTAIDEALVTAETNLAWTQEFEETLNKYYGISASGKLVSSFGITMLCLIFAKLYMF